MTDIESLVRNTVCRIKYRCRDIGYGVERGVVRGYWTGEVDCWGKYTIKALGGKTLYLFRDEIKRVAELDD